MNQKWSEFFFIKKIKKLYILRFKLKKKKKNLESYTGNCIMTSMKL